MRGPRGKIMRSLQQFNKAEQRQLGRITRLHLTGCYLQTVVFQVRIWISEITEKRF